MDENGRAFFTFIASSRWLGIVLDILVLTYAVLNVLLSVSLSSWLNIHPSLVAMTTSTILEVGGTFQYLVRMMIEIENSTTSVQRIHEYVRLPQEAPDHLPQDSLLLSQGWPSNGDIDFSDYTMRYRP